MNIRNARPNQRLWSLRVLLILFLLASQITFTSTALAATYAVTINGSSSGRQFNGVGGLSGGGGTSRLLYDYPAAQQSAILDYLFKPNYGASLQILKVEIGGDTDTTEGAEASSQRTPTDQNYQRGYEWWLMQQAKARNPNIKLYGLEWGAPSWFSGGFWSQDNINYIINWIKHAQSGYGLTINYIGGWNERGYNKSWYENLRSALNSNGLSSVQIVADDAASGWSVADDMTSDATFKAAVDIVGVHYTCGYLSNGANCSSTANAQNLGKPLWSSENGSQDLNTGAAAMARAINRDYIDGKMVVYINWNLIAAYYSTYPFANDGLMSAQQPWSGNYGVGKSIWVMAHTAQFVEPGWQYLDNSSGYLGGNRNNGSYVALKSTNNTDYSVIIETMDATSANTINFNVTGGLSTAAVHVWSTNLNSSSSSDYFVHASDITPSGGTFSLTIQPGYVYSLTTTTGQSKGTASSPASASMALPYTDNFESYTVGAMPNIPKYFATTMGAFEVENCLGGRSGKCMQQEITQEPITWCCSSALPQSAMGDPGWTNYTVSSDVLLPQAGAVELVGRMTAQYENNTGSLIGYHLQLSNTGSWRLYYLGGGTWASPNDTTLASGTVSYGTIIWTTLALTFNGSNIQAFIGGTQVANVTNSSSGSGQVAVQVQGWYPAQFDNFSITTGGSGPTNTPTPTPTPTNTSPGQTNTPTHTATPTSTSTGGTKYEAENAALSGGAVVATDHTGYSGTGFVAGYYTGTGQRTQFTVNVSTAGNYAVDLRYSNSMGSTQTESIYVNGVKVATGSYANLANWSTWADNTVTLALNAGINTIAYEKDSGNGCINLDYISVPGGGSGQTNTPTFTATPTITATGSVNLAQGKPASADSSQSANPASSGNDGSTSTRWCANDGNLNHWWEVDLGASYNLTGSEVMWEFNGRVYQYRVDVSTNNTSWTTVVDKTANTSTAQVQDDSFSATARYVRITITGLPASPTTWASFYEFRVFGN